MSEIYIESIKNMWAKKSDSNGLFKWLPLQQHLIDCENIICLLWEHWLSDGQKEIIVNSISSKNEEDAKKIIKFIAFTHDIGKAIPGFQAKKTFWFNSKDLDDELKEKLEYSGFTGIQSFELTSEKSVSHSLASKILLDINNIKEDISVIVASHHGKTEYISTNKKKINEYINAYKANFYQVEDEDSDIYQKWKNAQKDLFDWSLNKSGFNTVEEMPDITMEGKVLLTGLLIMADWISSNENYFPLINIYEDIFNINQEDRMKNGWLKWFNTFNWIPEKQIDIIDAYISRFGFEPREMQFKFSEAIKNSNEPGIFIIEAPMGVGKTEAALMGIEQLAYKTGASGMFFGLPTQATSNGIFNRISDWLEIIGSSDYEKKSLRLSHSKAHLNNDFISLAKNINIDDENHSWITVNQWFSGRKKTVLDDFVVGTVDNFLLLGLKQKHLALKHLGFSRKVVVIDEVHAYDAYMGMYLYEAIKWMGAYNIPVIILSATLPKDRRNKLIENYIRGRYGSIKNIKKDISWKEAKAYPLITFTEGESVMQITNFNKITDKEIKVNTILEDDLTNILNEKLSNGGIAGIIVNTVKKSQDLAKKLSEIFGDEDVELLHSSFIAADRVNKENDLLKDIGKNSKRPYKKIIVGTQVMEQSLDIDFDILFTDIAPMDLIIQRIGRLHRHEINRPEILKKPEVYILDINDEYEYSEENKYVYDEFLLMRTQLNLPEKLYIPKDISVLVQKVYDGIGEKKYDLFKSYEYENLGEDFKVRYEILYKESNNKIEKKENKAKVFRISKNKSTNLKNWTENSKSDTKENKTLEKAQVRDIEDSIEVIAVKKIENGYGFFNNIEDISNKIEDDNISRELLSQSIQLPKSLTKKYNIDKTIRYLEEYNKNKLTNWQDNIWLKGSLGIIFDDDNNCVINGLKLHYDKKHGLSYEKEV